MKFLIMLLPMALAACGTLPEPFYGDPGREGARLATPAAPVLVVPTPATALLDDASAVLYAQDLAAALARRDVPSLARPAARTDWQLVTTATLAGTTVIPHYVIIGSDGRSYGRLDGAAAAAAAWANGDPLTLAAQAAADAAALAKKLTLVNEAIQQGNPNSLENRVPRLYMGVVTGAPGDGDDVLALAMRRDLPGPEDELVTTAAEADFTVTGQIKPQPESNGQLLLELDWNVYDAGHRKVGQVTQLHEVAPGDVVPFWGDVAAAAALEAADGVQKVVQNATLRKAPPPS